jgi:hypothetical protein
MIGTGPRSLREHPLGLEGTNLHNGLERKQKLGPD